MMLSNNNQRIFSDNKLLRVLPLHHLLHINLKLAGELDSNQYHGYPNHRSKSETTTDCKFKRRILMRVYLCSLCPLLIEVTLKPLPFINLYGKVILKRQH